MAEAWSAGTAPAPAGDGGRPPAGVLARLARAAIGFARGVALISVLALAAAAAGLLAADWRLRTDGLPLADPRLLARLDELDTRAEQADRQLDLHAARLDQVAAQAGDAQARIDELTRRLEAASPAAPPPGLNPLLSLQLLVLRADAQAARGDRGHAAEDVEALAQAVDAFAAAGILQPALAEEVKVLAAAARDDLRLGRPSARARLDLVWQLLTQAAIESVQEAPPGAGAPDRTGGGGD